MEDKMELDRKTFIEIARVSGLDLNDAHMDELYAYLRSVLPGLRMLKELDVTDVEPVWPLILVR